MNKSKVSLAVSQVVEKIQKICGIFWAVLFGLTAVVSMFDDEADGVGLIITLWILAALGLWVYNLGKQRTQMRLMFKKYVAQLSADPSGSLEHLASATGTSVDVVKANLRYMIKKKFFTDAFINEETNQLVLPSMAQRVQQQARAPQYAAPGTAQPEFVACTCSCCGGMNKIVKGSIGECDFCGSPLQG